MGKQSKFVWMNGEIVPWGNATVHVSTETVLRAGNVFEGLRAYPDAAGSDVNMFRVPEHLRRLRQSMKIMRMTIPYTDEDLTDACIELIRANGFKGNVHFRPVVYFGAGENDAWDPAEIETGAFVLAFERPMSIKVEEGIDSCVSSWRRSPDVAAPSRVKAAGNYHNSRLAKVEARIHGFGSPIMLNERGKVSEGPAAGFFLVRDGVFITPPVTADILESITRATLIELISERLGLPILEREIDRSELYICDEAFFCGSGAEITPVRSIDRYPVGDGKVGELTRQLQKLYFDIVASRVPQYRHWLTPVYGSGT